MTIAPSPANPAPPQVLLAHHLRQLKLPTFLREYEKIAAEAAHDGLDHPRTLLRLAELELIDRERRMAKRRIRPQPSARRLRKLACPCAFPCGEKFRHVRLHSYSIAQQAARFRTRAVRIYRCA